MLKYFPFANFSPNVKDTHSYSRWKLTQQVWKWPNLFKAIDLWKYVCKYVMLINLSKSQTTANIAVQNMYVNGLEKFGFLM